MKKTILLLMTFIGQFILVSAQPDIQWQKSLGGTYYEEAFSIQQTSDGGYIVVGDTESNDGDVSGNHDTTGTFSDYWVVKLDSIGNIQWQKTFGGTRGDYAYSVIQTVQGDFIIAGGTSSNDGDVTGFHGAVDSYCSDDGFNFSRCRDCWIVKLDSSGNLIWGKTFGGTKDDNAKSIIQASDGGYIFAGLTQSIDGDISENNGSCDFWVVKLDTSGNFQWEKCLGGTKNEKAYSIQLTNDNGYIVAGYSYSNDGDISGHHGSVDTADCWIVKIDSIGNIQWQKCLGGTKIDAANSIQQASDGGFIVAGRSFSNNGDVTGHHGYTGSPDFWVVKLDNTGNILWQKSLGGTGYEIALSIHLTNDNGFIIAGFANSSDGDVTGNHGGGDYWVVKLDSTGNIQWQKCLGGTDSDGANSIDLVDNGGFIIAGWSNSNDSDVSGNHGDYDFWVVKLAPYNLSIVESNKNENINIYPNPANNKLSLEFQQSILFHNSIISISNIQGQILIRQNLKQSKTDIDINSLANGIYILKIEFDNSVVVKKFIKE
jgi:hypothetical protein